MENQIISDTKGVQLDHIKSKSIGRDLELAPPNTEAEIINNNQSEDLKEFARQIILLDSDSKKRFKIFHILLSISEKYPKVNLSDFTKTYLQNNAASTSTLLELTQNLSSKVSQISSNPNSVKLVDSFESKELKKLEPKRKKMINALKVVGVTYYNPPSMEVLSQDFKNIIINGGKEISSFDWDSLSNTIGKVTDTTQNITNAIGSVIGNVNQIKNQTSGRQDLNYTQPNYDSNQSKVIYQQLEKEDNTKYYLIGGGVLLIVIFGLVMLLKK